MQTNLQTRKKNFLFVFKISEAAFVSLSKRLQLNIGLKTQDAFRYAKINFQN